MRTSLDPCALSPWEVLFILGVLKHVVLPPILFCSVFPHFYFVEISASWSELLPAVWTLPLSSLPYVLPAPASILGNTFYSIVA